MFYTVTLTKRGGLNEHDIDEIVKHLSSCEHVYLANEFGQLGQNSHVQGIVEFDTDKTSNVTERMRRMYIKLGIEFVRGVSVRVAKVVDMSGAILYASKELGDKGKQVLLQGWESSWILEQVQENVKKIPFKTLKGKGIRMTQSTAGALIFEYAKARNYYVTDQETYREICVMMAKDGYLFGNLRHMGVIQDVCALFGDGEAVGYAIDAALKFFNPPMWGS